MASRRRFLRRFAALGAVTTVGMGGCQSLSDEGGIDSMDVALLEPRVGTYESLGTGEIEGVELAKDELESEFDVSIDLVTKDTETTDSVGVQRIREAFREDEVDWAMGGVSSSVAISMGQWADANEEFFLTSGSHSAATTGSECRELMFRAPCNAVMLGRALGQYMVEAAQDWYFVWPNYTWGETAFSETSAALRANGGTVSGDVRTELGAEEYTAAFETAAQADVDGIAVCHAGADLRRAIEQFHSLGLESEFTLAAPVMEDQVAWDLGFENLSGIYSMVWTVATTNERSETLKQKFLDRGITPWSRTYLGYVTLDQGVRAAMRAGSLDPAEMQQALEGHKFEGWKANESRWRSCDNQLLQDTYVTRVRDEPQTEPYTNYFEVVETFPAEDVVRSCEETGCSVE